MAMNIGGWVVNADYLIGRRFSFVNAAAPDMTLVAGRQNGDAEEVRAHVADGGKWWVNVDDIALAIATGILVEAIEPPFTLGRQ